MTQFFTRPWDSQPQEAVALDRGGAAAGIYACQFPPAGLGRDVSGIPVTSSGVSLSAGPAGLAFLFAGAGTADVSIQTPAAWSVSVLCDAPTLSGTCGLFSMGDAAYSVICRTESGVLKLYQYEGTDKVVTGPTLSAGPVYLISASWTGSSVRLFVNGALAGSTAVGSIRSSVTWRVGGSVGAAERWTGRVYAASYFTRPRTDAEHAQEAAAPWQLFEPRRVYIPMAAGGAGAQTLTPSLYSDSQSFFAPAVSVGAVSLAPSLFTDGHTFYAPTVAGGAVALSPSLLTNAQAFYAPTVTQAGQALSPSLYSNSQSFYAPTVTVGAVDLTPGLFTSTSSFFVPYVSDGSSSGFVRYFDVLSGRLLILKPLGAVTAASGATWTEVEVDFGSSPVYGAEFTITDAAITAASKVQVLPCGKAAAGRTADDWAWDGAAFAANPGAGWVNCYAQFLPGPIVGLRKVQYSVGA